MNFMETSTSNIDQALADVVNIIRSNCNPLRIILFGSYARGNPCAHSDLDILIVVPNGYFSNRNRVHEHGRLGRELSKVHIPKDILMYTQDEYQEHLQSLNHVVSRAANDGIVLHEAA